MAIRVRRGPRRQLGAQSAPAAPGTGLHNHEVAAAFTEMAELLAIHGDNPFRIRAYQRAAQVIQGLPQPLTELHGAADFDALPGIGADLAGKIDELLRTGRLQALEQLRRKVPAGLRALLQLPGLGPVRVRALHAGLGVRDVDDLRRQLAAGRLARIRGFGPGLQQRLRTALLALDGAPTRWRWTEAAEHAESLRAHLAAAPGIITVEIAGSYRRGRDTVGDLDFVVCAHSGTGLLPILSRYGDLKGVLASGPTRCTIALRSGLQADFRLVPKSSLGAALHYFTGSRDHNVRLRHRAQRQGLRLNEYGLFRGRRQLAGATEEDVYAALGLPWIPPELRENRGEIEAAERRQLPKLIDRSALAGDLHVHTDASDGLESLERMVGEAQAQGLQYIGIADHSRHLGLVHGLDADRLARQIDAIDALNATLRDFVVFKGVEVDILEDGKLALPDGLLSRLDFVVAAIHTHFGLSEQLQTARILRALEHPSVSILAHPTCRLLGERDPIALNLKRILEAARSRPCYLELNAQPDRLDLDDLACKAARDLGVMISIASDAHAGADFANLAHGIRQARRGWLCADDVINARPAAALRRLLARTRGSS